MFSFLGYDADGGPVKTISVAHLTREITSQYHGKELGNLMQNIPIV